MKSPRKPRGTYRIFFVGASTTENAFLPEEKTFPGLVEAGLTERFHGAPRIEVANAAISGFGVARSLALVEHALIPLEPDLIVVLDGANDCLSDLDGESPLEPFEAPTLRDWITAQSRLVGLLDARLSRKDSDMRRFLARRRRVARATPYTRGGDLDPRPGLARFKQRLTWLALVCREAGVPVVFLTQPTLWKSENAPAERDAMVGLLSKGGVHLDPAASFLRMEAYNEAIRAVAREQRMTLVDLACEVPATLEDFCDDVHMTAAGNRRVAETILRALASGKLPTLREGGAEIRNKNQNE
jgi:lysophospholipase L1-like esterase